MDTPIITILYAGLFGLMSIVLGYLAGAMRGRLGIPIGDGGNDQLLLAMRRQANFHENVPITLLMIALLELNGVGPLSIHALALALLTFRILHAIGISADSVQGTARIAGAAGTALTIVITSIWCVVVFVTG